MVGQGASRRAVVETVSPGISARWAQQRGRLRRSANIPFADRAEFLALGEPAVDADNVVLMSARKNTQLGLVFKLFETDDTFNGIVLFKLRVEKDLDGEVADHLCRSQIGSKLLTKPDPPDQV